MKKDEILLASMILLLAAVLRLYDLGNVPFFFDESIHAVITGDMLRGNYAYDPRYHGPLLYYSLSAVVSWLGKSEFAYRLIPAVLGVGVVAVTLLYRRYIGWSAYLAALFVAVSPIIVNYSRFCRADMYQLFFVSLAAYFLLRYYESENRRLLERKVDRGTLYMALVGLFLGLFASVKETFYVLFPLFACFVLWKRKFRLIDVLVSLLSLGGVYFTLYTNFWSKPEIVLSLDTFPAVEAFEYWWSQHTIARIGGPWYYFLELMLIYDLPLLVLSFVSVGKCINALRGRQGKEGWCDTFTLFFVLLYLYTFAFHSYMQEKLPWLAVHIEYPAYLLAAKVLGEWLYTSDPAHTLRRKSSKMVFVVSVLYLLAGCLAINFLNPVNYAEPAIYLPTTYEARDTIKEIPEGATVQLLMNLGESYPLLWYIMDNRTWYFGGEPNPGVDVVIANQSSVAKADAVLKGWNKKEIVVRCWTFWTVPQIEKIPSFLLLRKPLTGVSCMNFTVYT